MKSQTIARNHIFKPAFSFCRSRCRAETIIFKRASCMAYPSPNEMTPRSAQRSDSDCAHAYTREMITCRYLHTFNHHTLVQGLSTFATQRKDRWPRSVSAHMHTYVQESYISAKPTYLSYTRNTPVSKDKRFTSVHFPAT